MPRFENWGLINYQEALDRQLLLVEKVWKKNTHDTVVFCSHPPIVTLGRKTQSGDVVNWQGETLEIQRGGRATYHGPSQLVGYPIFDLTTRGKDLHKYLRFLEDRLVRLLESLDLKADGGQGDTTGVWVNGKKVASIGIGVKHWVTYHGFALNVEHDPKAFQGINPCGFDVDVMTSLEAQRGTAPPRETLIKKLEELFLEEETFKF